MNQSEINTPWEIEASTNWKRSQELAADGWEPFGVCQVKIDEHREDTEIWFKRRPVKKSGAQ